MFVATNASERVAPFNPDLGKFGRGGTVKVKTRGDERERENPC